MTDGSHWQPEKYQGPLDKDPLYDALDRFGGMISWSPSETLDDFLKRYDATRRRELGMPTKDPDPEKP